MMPSFPYPAVGSQSSHPCLSCMAHGTKVRRVILRGIFHQVGSGQAFRVRPPLGSPLKFQGEGTVSRRVTSTSILVQVFRWFAIFSQMGILLPIMAASSSHGSRLCLTPPIKTNNLLTDRSPS